MERLLNILILVLPIVSFHSLVIGFALSTVFSVFSYVVSHLVKGVILQLKIPIYRIWQILGNQSVEKRPELNLVIIRPF